MKNKLLVLLTMSFFSLSHSAVAKGSQSNNSAVDTIKRLYVQDGFPPYQNRHDAFTPALRRLLELEQQASERLQEPACLDYDIVWGSGEVDDVVVRKSIRIQPQANSLVRVSFNRTSKDETPNITYYKMSCNRAGCLVADILSTEKKYSLRAELSQCLKSK
ncbi:TPA: hypothetical protein ACFNMI_000319 [Neisseria bacilliformis]|jgi:hypothetical protein|uniref:hypothetical protein n=1 Tax=Neisseriaceae TaxID=481 RepID=UPI0012B58D7C|nr:MULTISPECIES: hypothetical protein [Neisseriaceae]QMT47439.1 hypothetical protein H3L91_11215 [Neisseria bacilliformis]